MNEFLFVDRRRKPGWSEIKDKPICPKIRNNKQIERVFTPTMDEEGRDTRIKGWEKAIKMARFNG